MSINEMKENLEKLEKAKRDLPSRNETDFLNLFVGALAAQVTRRTWDSCLAAVQNGIEDWRPLGAAKPNSSGAYATLAKTNVICPHCCHVHEKSKKNLAGKNGQVKLMWCRKCREEFRYITHIEFGIYRFSAFTKFGFEGR